MTLPLPISRNLKQIRTASLVLLSGIVLLVTVSAQAQVNFGSGASYPAGTGPWGISSGDFNGDGFPDLAVANHGSGGPGFGNGISVLLGKADGTFNNPVNYSGGVGPTYLVTGDFNHDGRADVATANTESDSISVLPSNTDGTFGAAVNYPTGHRPSGIVAADFNRDGSLDFAFPISGTSVSVMLADGNGGFQPIVNYNAAAGSQAIAVGDFNKDGKLDIVTDSSSAKSVSVLLGNGNGTFQTPIFTALSASTQPGQIVVGDFNRDGKSDIAVAFLVPPSVNIMLGNGSGGFASPSFSIGSINTPADLKGGDFNGDGRTDLVSTGVFLGPNADIFLGKGDGTLQNPVPFGLSPGAIAANVADFNGDTRPDLAIVANGLVSVVMINATPGLPDDTDYFIHQHYLDFLSREPDVFGFDYWTDHIDECGANPACLLDRRIGTSAAFMIESEFQLSGYFVYRLYNASFGRRPSFSEFTVDRRKVIGGPELNASKAALVSAFVRRDQFRTVYPDSLSNPEFVNKLFDSAALIPFIAERQAAIDALNGGADRASILRSVVDNATLMQREYNPAFVQMQYLGYLKRTEDQRGFQFWLDILNQQPTNYRRMVCAFITSEEYQRRFTNNITHSNAECDP
jgi:FG-GAP-like repeat/Domain of unknown function (DUF4214)